MSDYNKEQTQNTSNDLNVSKSTESQKEQHNYYKDYQNNRKFNQARDFLYDPTDEILDVSFNVLADNNFKKRRVTSNKNNFQDYNRNNNKQNKKKKIERLSFEINLSKKEINLNDLSRLMNIKSSDIIIFLKKNDFPADDNTFLDVDIATFVVESFGGSLKYIEDKNIEEILNINEKNYNILERDPIVTVIGHVDHGKTTLLDLLRNTRVAEKEAGGITQKMNSHKINFKNKSIVFIDTPGHAAFQNMRYRSSNIADLAVLIIAADDGINTQTIEIIEMIKKSNIPFLVAVNKVDKVQNLEKSLEIVKNKLMSYDIICEDFGGETVIVPISAKNNINTDKLLDAILLQAEMLELKARFEGCGIGQIIDSKIDSRVGITADIVIKNGNFNRGDFIVSGTSEGKIKIIEDNSSLKIIQNAKPSSAVKIVGLNTLPKAGDFIYSLNDKTKFDLIKENLKTSNQRIFKPREEVLFQDQEKKIEFKVILKSESQGSLEALLYAAQDIKVEGTELRIVSHKTGEILDSDLDLAKITNSIIYNFGSKTDKKILQKAINMKVICKEYNIIYQLLEDIKKSIENLFEPIAEEIYSGKAEIRNIFNISKTGLVYGCMVLDGVIYRNYSVKIKRKDLILNTTKISSLRRIKEDVKEVGSGFECGISIEKDVDVKIGDIFEVYNLVYKPRFQ